MTASRPLDRQQRVALTISGSIVGISLVYWIAQILGVIEMLKLAYG